MQILRKTGTGIRPEFWGWSSYTQLACLSACACLLLFFSFSFFFFLCFSLSLLSFFHPSFSSSFFSVFLLQASIQIHVDNSVFTEKKTLKSYKFISTCTSSARFLELLSQNPLFITQLWHTFQIMLTHFIVQTHGSCQYTIKLSNTVHPGCVVMLSFLKTDYNQK